MTSEQFERWKDFAIRAAKMWYVKSRRPSAAWVLGTVEDFFADLDEDIIPCVVNWDNSTVFPEGNPSRHREYQTTYCGCDGWRSEHGTPNPECPECRGSGVHHAWEKPYCIGDEMTEFLSGLCGYAPRCRACREYEYEGECYCEDKEYLYYEQWNEQWGGPIHCCIRAGLDMACAPSGGVVGFTAGDIRKMYPEGVPEWLFPPGEKLVYALTDPVVVNGTFDELPDNADLWL